jgi:hypothetical protein
MQQLDGSTPELAGSQCPSLVERNGVAADERVEVTPLRAQALGRNDLWVQGKGGKIHR